MRTSRVRSAEHWKPAADQVEHLVEDALPGDRARALSALVKRENRVLHLGLSWTCGRVIPTDLMSTGAGGHRRGDGDRRPLGGRIIVAPGGGSESFCRCFDPAHLLERYRNWLAGQASRRKKRST